jgi:branched-subunit amino acid aminotransferase/4-amino-4-deoxychorismate lyase
MLPSYLAYREARQNGAYDALLINRNGHITEGTRTNFFALRDRTIYSPPEAGILLGVTRDHVLKVAKAQGFEIVEQDLPLDSINSYDYTFITSTSTKIMPLSSIDDYSWPEIPANLKELMAAFETFLDGPADSNL